MDMWPSGRNICFWTLRLGLESQHIWFVRKVITWYHLFGDAITACSTFGKLTPAFWMKMGIWSCLKAMESQIIMTKSLSILALFKTEKFFSTLLHYKLQVDFVGAEQIKTCLCQHLWQELVDQCPWQICLNNS